MQNVNVMVNEHYGDNLIPLEFPRHWEIKIAEMECKGIPPMTDDEIITALDNTIGAPNITDQARGKKGRIVITCDDLSRPTPAGRVFPFIVEQLMEAGITDDQIFVLGSFGLHHPMNLDAFSRKLGNWVVAKYDCINHNPFFNHVNIGRTSRGTPLKVNKEFADADLRICISGVKKHRWAGAGGGGKAIVPGVASIDTILYNHSIIEGRRPKDRRIWWIKDNPERQDMQECARMADLNLSINCVYDGMRRLIGLYPGDVDEAWKEGVKAAYAAHDTKIAPQSDIVVSNAYPQADQDIDWTGIKASLREGGTAIGVHHFRAGRAILHYGAEQMGAPWARELRYPKRNWPVQQAGNTLIYTDRPSKRQMLAYDDRVEWITDWSLILGRLKSLHGENAKVSVYPCGKLQYDSKKNTLDL
jgi:nickel-dependent lactate racemase